MVLDVGKPFQNPGDQEGSISRIGELVGIDAASGGPPSPTSTHQTMER